MHSSRGSRTLSPTSLLLILSADAAAASLILSGLVRIDGKTRLCQKLSAGWKNNPFLNWHRGEFGAKSLVVLNLSALVFLLRIVRRAGFRRWKLERSASSCLVQGSHSFVGPAIHFQDTLRSTSGIPIQISPIYVCLLCLFINNCVLFLRFWQVLLTATDAHVQEKSGSWVRFS